MKIKNITTVLLIPFFLVACASVVTYDPTETAIPSFTETSVVQATSMPNPTVTPEGEPRVEVSVGGETMSYTNKVVGSEATVSVEASRVQRLGQPGIQVDVLNTENGRFIWNAAEDAWSQEVLFPARTPEGDIDVLNPDTTFLFPNTEVVDNGSAALSALLYFAEHPEVMPKNAVDVQWKINTIGGAIEIAAFRDNQGGWPPSDSTPALNGTDISDLVPHGWVGMFRVLDAGGNEIVVLSQIKKNTPTFDNPMPYMPVFFGIDRETYDSKYLGKSSQGNIIIDLNVNQHSKEVTIVLPVPSGNKYLDVTSLEQMGGGNNPHVAQLLTQSDTDNMFTATELAEINAANVRLADLSHNAFSEPEWSFSTRLSTLPDELMNMIVYPGLNAWSSPGK